MTHTDLLEVLAEAEKALDMLIADVAAYEAWQRPCHALDVARATLVRIKEATAHE